MNQLPEGRARPQSVAEAIARTLRHEVGDLLQTVYAAVAILKERLPAECQAERRILTDMRTARNRAATSLIPFTTWFVRSPWCPRSWTWASMYARS